MKIKVEKRTGDYMAYVEGNPDIWESGQSWEAAVGRLAIRLGLIEVIENA